MPDARPHVSAATRRRPVYLNLPRIRQPIPAIASILHRISGAALFFFGVPFVLCAVQASLTSAEAFEGFRAQLDSPLVKLALFVLLWAYIHHTLAGIRHLLMDVHVGEELKPARLSATIATVGAVLLTLVAMARLW
ncbi:MAG TPA: succinate dehydrogenase, cytochrome b556 subunit [Casimicrobiaceae bacterium]|nr:succinate dehydrogenase, cytochrome b556 subunit [Casimicrobiaceae bacterium]